MPGARIVGGDIDLHAVIRLLDDEFLAARGRSGSLAWRLPDLFDDPQSHIQVVLAPSGDLAAACCCKRFAWLSQKGQPVQGGMIGLVTTTQTYRRQGYGRRVVEDAVGTFAAAGIEIATLWTTIPAFYSNFGWRMSVSGAYGTLGSPNGKSKAGRSSPRWVAAPFDAATINAIEIARTGLSGLHVSRSPLTYRKLPAATERLWLGQASDAYILVGEEPRGATAFEIEGDEDAALALLDATARRWPGTMVNDRPDGIATRAAGLAITNLAMWLPLTSDAPDDKTWFVPYLDRI